MKQLEGDFGKSLQKIVMKKMNNKILAVIAIAALAFLIVGKPHLTPDEGGYAVFAKNLAEGKSPEESGLKNRILHIFLLSIPVKIFGYSLLAMETIAFAFGLAAVVLVFLLARKIGASENSAFYASVFFAIAPLSVVLSRGMLSEMPAIAFALASVFAYASSKNRVGAVFAAVLAGISFLIREPIIIAIGAFMLATHLSESKNGFGRLDRLAVFSIAFIAIISLWSAVFKVDYLFAYSENVKYVSQVADSVLPKFLMIPFSIALGGAAACLLAAYAFVRGNRNFLMWAWLAIAIAAMVVIPRVEVRYALPAIVPLAILAGEGAEKIARNKFAMALLLLASLIASFAFASYWNVMNNPAVFHETASFVKENGGIMVSQLCFDYESLNYGLQIKCMDNASVQDFNQGAVLVEHSNHVARPEWMKNCTLREIFRKDDSWLVIKHSISAYGVQCAAA